MSLDRQTAISQILRIPQEQKLVREALKTLYDDLEAAKLDIKARRINGVTGYDEFLNGKRGYEPVQLRNFPYRVGIGMYTPEVTLHVQDIRGLTSGQIIDVASDVATDRAQINLRRTRSYHNARLTVQDGDLIYDIRGSAYTGAAFVVSTMIRSLCVGAANGTGELRFYTNPAAGVALRFGIDPNGNVYVGSKAAALAANATDGFLYVDTCAGTPTGAPTAITGTVPLVYDTTNNRLYFYNGSAWQLISGEGDFLGTQSWFDLANITTLTAWASNTGYYQYIGRAGKSASSVNVNYRVATAGAGAATWAEIGIFKGPIVINGNASLTRLGTANVAAVVNSLGIKNTTVNLTTAIRAGDDLWVAAGGQFATTQWQARGCLADDIQSGIYQTGGRPSTAAVPFTGTLAGATLVPGWFTVKLN